MGSSNPPKLNKYAAAQREAAGSTPAAVNNELKLNPHARLGGLVDYTAAYNIMAHNRERTANTLERLRADSTAIWEENRRREIYNSWLNSKDNSLAAQMLKDRAALSQRNQPISTGLDDNSLAYQMLKDRAASEKNQQSLPLAQRIQNISTPGTYSVSDYADLAKSFTGTPAQDALDAYVKERTDYRQYLKAPDFQKYSKLGADIQNPSFSDAQGLFSLFGLRPGAQEVGNIVTFSRDNIEKIQERLDSDDRATFVGNALYSSMSEDEVGIYNYLLAKEGKGAAARYLEAIEETLNAQYGAKVAADVNNSKLLKPVLTAGVATSAGLDRYAQNIKQLANEYRLPTSAVQFTGQEVREDLGALGRVAYDVVNQISYQAPSILVSYVAGALGAPAKAAEWMAAASTGLSAAGGSYNQALAEGRSKEEAQTVSALIGASEAVLSKLLSGIGAYGGLTSKKLLPKVAAIENAAWRVLGAAGVKIGGEVSEELLQEFLEPLFKTVVYGDEYDTPTIGALAYTAFVTALTTGIMEGGEIAKFRTPEGARAAAGVEQTSESKVSEEKTVSVADSVAPAGSQRVSETGSDLGRGKVANAPAGSQTDTQGLQISSSNRDAAAQMPQTQQNKNSAAQTQRIESNSDTGAHGMSSLDIETIRVALAEGHENGKISDADYDAAMEAIMEQESLSDTGSGSLDMYNPQLIEGQEVNTNGRSSISDGGSQWAASQSAGEQVGKLAEGAGRYQIGQVQSQRAASRRNDVARYYESQGQGQVSAREFLGTNKVNKVSTVQEVPASMVSEDSELAAIAEDIRSMGMTPHFFTGEAYLQNGSTVDAMIRDNEVYIRVDSEKWTAAQNWEHEKAHAALRHSSGIEAELYGKIVGRGEAARRKLHQTIQRYREAYHGIYDVDENGNEIWDITVQEMIMQEILADAYSGKDTYGQDTQQYSSEARAAIDQIRDREMDTRGPPEDRFTIVEDDSNAGEYRVIVDRDIFAGVEDSQRAAVLKQYLFQNLRGAEIETLQDQDVLYISSKNKDLQKLWRPGAFKSPKEYNARLEVASHIDEAAAASKLADVEPNKKPDTRPNRGDVQKRKVVVEIPSWDDHGQLAGVSAWDVELTAPLSLTTQKRTAYDISRMDKKTTDPHSVIYRLQNAGLEVDRESLPRNISENLNTVKPTVKRDGESFSANGLESETQSEGTDTIEAMPAKARKFMESAESKLQRSLAQVMGYSEKVSKDSLAEISREISHEFLQTGTVSDETIDRSFEKIYSGIEADVEKKHGIDAEDYRQWAERDYIAEVSKHLAELRLVRRYAVEKAEKAAAEKSIREMTMEDLTQAYADLKVARRGADKAVARNLLTDEDNRKVNALLRGDLDLDMLRPDQDNVKGITEVYNAKLEYEKIARKIRQWNAQRKQGLSVLADELLATAGDWKDKKAGILYSRETMERNIRDIVPDKDVAQKIVDTLFKPVHDGAAASNKMKNEYRARVRELNLSRKVAKGNTISEAAAVQLLGDAEDNIRLLQQNNFMKERDGKTLEEWNTVVQNLWEANPKLDAQKIRKAIDEFRVIYDELFAQMNEARIRNGYEPVNYRKGYFPHFQNDTGDGILSQFGKSLGINTAALQLPTTINGLTHTFKPGMQWFGSAQQRLGYETTFDAVEGFDSYIEGVADVIHQTDNIQRLRAFASQVRYRTSDDGLRKQVDQVKNDPHLAELDKHNRIKDIYEDGRYELGNFAVELDEYTNLLAGKKSRHDRDMEQRLGRRCYAIMKALEGRVAANMVAINPGSWLTNFIPITQGAATLDTTSLLSGMWDTLRSYKTDDGFVASSSFLTNRRGSDPLVRTWAQEASAKLSSPMELIDAFTADTLVRARYNENKRRGLSDSAAMADADTWAAGVMADRSKGAMPTLFSQTNPITKLFTQFQLEVNNQLSYVFKDIPRETLEKGAATFAMALLKFMLGAYLYDEIYEYAIGRRPALDPLGILNDSVGDITGYELPNLVEWGVNAAQGKETSFKVEKKGPYAAVKGATAAILEELPFIGSLMGGGRLPISSALPDWENLGKALFSEGWDEKKKWSAVGKELAKPATYLALPFGGGQVKKALEGGKAVMEGGSYSVNSKGERILQYPVYNDTPGQIAGNALRSAFFGKSSLPTAQEWVEGDFNSLGAKQTALYESLVRSGAAGEEAYQLILDIENTDGKANKLQVIADSSLGEDLKELALTKQFTFSQYKKYMAARSANVPTSDYIKFLDLLSQEANAQHYENRDGQPSTSEVENEMWSSNLSAEDVRQFWDDNYKLSKEYEKMYEQFEAETELGNGSITASVLKKVLNKTSFTSRQKRAIWKSYGWKSDSPW